MCWRGTRIVYLQLYPKLNGSLSRTFVYIVISFIGAYALYLLDKILSKSLLRNVKK